MGIKEVVAANTHLELSKALPTAGTMSQGSALGIFFSVDSALGRFSPQEETHQQ